MDVLPNANALITVTEARDFFPGKTSPSEDLLLQELVNAASDYVVNDVCRWPLKATTYTALRLAAPRMSCQLYPPAAPIDVTKTITMSVNGLAQSVWKSESDGDPATKEVLVLADPGVAYANHFYRPVGWGASTSNGHNPRPILLSYTGGFDPLPDDLKQAVKMVVQTFYRHRLVPQDVASYGGGGVMPPGVVMRPDSYIPMQALAILQSYARVQV